MTGSTTNHSIQVQGTAIHYRVHGDLADPGDKPVLLVAGFPMSGDEFEALAQRMGDRAVVTYDPRGVGRSVRSAADDRLLGPADHASDIAAIIDALGVGAVDVFASSGGAINALALMEHHGELVHLLVAHEPPLTQFLPDRRHVQRVMGEIGDSYQREGFGPAMARFIKLVMHDGELDEDYLHAPAPEPQVFGLPTTDDGSRDDPMLAGSIHNGPSHQLDASAITAVSRRIRIGVGDESGGGVAARGARSAAEALGLTVVGFPGGHGSFVADAASGGRPDEFAARLRDVLDPTL